MKLVSREFNFLSLVRTQIRHFNKPAGKAPAGKGGPASTPSAAPEAIQKTPFQDMIAEGAEFILGPPPGVNKVQGAHRDVVIPKAAPRIEIFAKKLRDFYIREGTIAEQKTYINPLRERLVTDTIEKMLLDRTEVPGVIEARDEFPDMDLIFPWSVPHLIKRSEHGTIRPWYLKHNGEEIRVTLNKIDWHVKSNHPYFLNLQRYIVGKPNLLQLPIYPVQEDKSLHYQAGSNFQYLIKDLYVWCFTDKYPPRIEVDCQNLSPTNPIKIGDIELMLPYGMYLHKMYQHQKFKSIVKLKPTNLYVQRKNAVVEQAEAIQDQRKKMALNLIEKSKEQSGGTSTKKKPVKSVPMVSQSTKFMVAEKKESEKADKAAAK